MWRRQTLPDLPLAAVVQDAEVRLNGDAAAGEAVLRRVLADAAQDLYTPVANSGGFVDFQLSRRLLRGST